MPTSQATWSPHDLTPLHPQAKEPAKEANTNTTHETKRPPTKRPSKEDLMLLQYECLQHKRDNLLLKRRKLEMEVELLENQMHAAAMTNYL